MKEAPSHDFGISLPVLPAAREIIGGFEFNLSGRGTLTLEGGIVRGGELLSDDEVEETKDSLESKGGFQGGLILSRYTDPVRMAGFFFGVGAGYRQEKVKWTRTPAQREEYSAALLSVEGKLYHEATLAGATGHARVGYRYVGEEIPFAIGIALGVRHFEAGYREEKERDDALSGDSTRSLVAPTPKESQEGLERRIKTGLEGGIAIGYIF